MIAISDDGRVLFAHVDDVVVGLTTGDLDATLTAYAAALAASGGAAWAEQIYPVPPTAASLIRFLALRGIDAVRERYPNPAPKRRIEEDQ